MKFAQKLTIAILLLLCLTLSVGGAFSIQQNFSHALAVAEKQDTFLHLRECYAMEQALKTANLKKSVEIFDAAHQYEMEQQAAFGKSSPPFTLFNGSGAPIYSNISQQITYMDQWNAVQAGSSSGKYVRKGDRSFLLLGSLLEEDETLWLVNSFEVTNLFEERDRQLSQYGMLELVVLVLAGIAAALVSVLMTRPLRRLEQASRKIAEGTYSSRVQVTSEDELGQLGESFNAMAQAVEEHMAALEEESQKQKRFVAAFTHEIKTPMTAILGYANLLRSAEQPAEKRQIAANYIYHESNRLEHLSRSLLALLGLEKETIQLEETALSAVLADLKRSLPQLKAELCVEGEKEGRVMADRVLLVDLLHNLVLNAVSAEPADGKVRILCTREESGWRVAVADKGRGMSAQEVEKVLEPFYRVDKSRARQNGGNGLGLSLCDRIARVHGSNLQIKSAPGQGTEVSVLLKEAGI